MHNFDDGGEPDTPLPLHKVSFSLYSIKLICILLIEMVRDTSIQIEESAFYIKSVCWIIKKMEWSSNKYVDVLSQCVFSFVSVNF